MACCKTSWRLGIRKRFICMLVLTFSFFLAEIVVGYVTNSVALIADSFHMLSDAVSIVVGLLAVIYSEKRSKYNTYGWVRTEVLGAFANAVFLLALCFNIIIEAIQRLVEVEDVESPLLVLGVGVAGLIINIAGLFLFHGHAHGHSHDHGNHDHTEHSGGSQMNMRAVFLHVLGDALGSIVVIVNALVIYFVEGSWRYYLDPVMSLCISGIIICTTIPLLKQSSLILLQNPPGSVKPEDMVNKLNKISGVASIHDLHIWQLSVGRVVASMHIIMHVQDDFVATANEVNKLCHDSGIHSITLQPEYCQDCSITSPEDVHVSAGLSEIPVEGACDDATSLRRRSVEGTKGIHKSCLLSCVTQECRNFRCCKVDFVGLDTDVVNGIVNENYCEKL